MAQGSGLRHANVQRQVRARVDGRWTPWAHVACALLVLCLTAGAALANHTHPIAPSKPAILFFHGTGADEFAVNTQVPPPNLTMLEVRGAAMSSTSCVPPVAGQSVLGQETHTYYAYSSPSMVEYDRAVDGHPRIHPERGLAADVDLDASKPWTLHWFLQTATPGNAASAANAAPLVVPSVFVHAAVRTGDGIGIGPEAANQGQILAEGRSTTMTLSPDAPNHSMAADGSHLYEFVVSLEPQTPVLPALTGFLVRIDVAMEVPGCDDPGGAGYFMPNEVLWRSEADHRIRMELSLFNPVRVVSFHAEDDGAIASFWVQATSPWGNYDLRETAEMSITGPTPATSVRQLVEGAGGGPENVSVDQAEPGNQSASQAQTGNGSVSPSVVYQAWRSHGGGLRPASWKFHWYHGKDGALPGTYEARVTLQNLQGQSVNVTIPFEIAPAKRSPGAGAFLGAAVIVVAAMVRRRMRRPEADPPLDRLAGLLKGQLGSVDELNDLVDDGEEDARSARRHKAPT